jgi:hypothetical protein
MIQKIELQVSDVSAQKLAKVKDIPADATVSELVEGLLAELKLPRQDVEGRPLSYGVRRKRDGMHLQGVEKVGTALASGEAIVLLPNVDAG